MKLTKTFTTVNSTVTTVALIAAVDKLEDFCSARGDEMHRPSLLLTNQVNRDRYSNDTAAAAQQS